MTFWNSWRYVLMCVVLLGSIGCSLTPQIESNWLDSESTKSPFLDDPTALVSERFVAPSLEQKEIPVIIAVHGYSATAYEWEEFKTYAEEEGVYVSLVTMGGHGLSYEDFQKSTWEEWGRTMLLEYEALIRRGYKHISFATASTGGTLLLQHAINNQLLLLDRTPDHIFMIDPLLVAKNKLLYLVPKLKVFLGDQVNDSGTAEEQANWYMVDPLEALLQLESLMAATKRRLEGGVTLPSNTQLKIYKTTGDDVVEPLSAYLIWKGLTHADGSKIEVEMLDSDKHVFTRLQGRSSTTQDDINLQQRIFAEMVSRVKSNVTTTD